MNEQEEFEFRLRLERENGAKPAAPQKEQSILDRVIQANKNIGGGLLRGAGSIGATAMRLLPNALGGDTAEQNTERRNAMDSALSSMGADTNSLGYGAGKLGAEIAGTAGAGGAIGNIVGRGAQAFGLGTKAAPVVNALTSSGMTTGAAPVGFAAKAGDLALRTGAGATVGAGSAAATGDSALAGGVVGGILPGALKAVGAAGGFLGSALGKLKSAATGNASGAGEVFSKAMGGLSPQEMDAFVKAARSAPNEIVPGSKLTFSQALQYVGKGDPNVNFLERVVSQGPGGGKLISRYADQNTARLDMLKAQGAQIYDGAPKIEAHEAGNLLGGVIRTQEGDVAAALRKQWEALEQQATKEGTALQFPLEDMQKAMAPFGGGSFVRPKQADNALKEAYRIGQELTPESVIPAIKPLPMKGNRTQTLEQAIRSAGGIKDGKYLSGELKDLASKQSGTSGLINNKSGKQLDLLAEQMNARGFIPDSDPATLIAALRNGGGRKVYAADANEGAFQRAAESAMGDMPGKQVIPESATAIPVPYNEFQRLRRDAGQSAATIASRDPKDKEIGVLNAFEQLLSGRVDKAASGNLLAGESMTPEFRNAYIAARDATKGKNEVYGTDKIAKILGKQYGGNYNLNGDEVFNQLWHGSGGLSQDVASLKNVMGSNSPAMDKFRQAIMSEAAGKTTAANNLESAFPKYVNSRITGINEAMTPDQAKALTDVARDIQNATRAQNVKGLSGSDTAAKISKAMESGIMDTATGRAFSNALNYKTPGVGVVRNFLVDVSRKSKGNTLSEMLANPKYLEKALGDYMNLSPSKAKVFFASPEGERAMNLVYKAAPVAIAQ